MRKFSFSLESVRALRGHEESVAKEALAREIAVGIRREAELRSADATLASALEGSRPADAATGEALAARQAWIERCERARSEARLGVAAQQQRVDARRDELREAAAGRAAVERLRERRLADHAREELREETGELGEIALTRAARKRHT